MINVEYTNGISYKKGYTYFYKLVDPITFEICYVGKAINPDGRYRQHMKIYSNNRLMMRWIWGLKDLGKSPIMVVFDFTSNKNEVAKIETDHIKWHWEQGHPLLNQKDVFTKKTWRHQLAWEKKIIQSRWLNERCVDPNVFFGLIQNEKELIESYGWGDVNP